MEISTRIISKNDTKGAWEELTNKFTPMEGEIIVYNPDYDEYNNPEGYKYSRIKIGDGNQDISKLPFITDYIHDLLNYDLVITNEDIFDKCLYNISSTPDLNFTFKKILVKDVIFTHTHGTSDSDLDIFQPSIEYIKFENCSWKCKWRVSGAKPTINRPGTNEYLRATDTLKLTIDGIHITEEAVREAKELADTDKSTRYYIGLRNIGRLQNCWIDYPEDYTLSDYGTPEKASYKESLKCNLQYFDTADNCKLTAFWDGESISNCWVTEQLNRCKNIININTQPMYEPSIEGEAKVLPIELIECVNVANVYGSSIKYKNCRNISADTCDGYTAPVIEEYLIDEYDLIINSAAKLQALQTNTDAKTVLVKGFNINSSVDGFFTNTIKEENIPKFIKFIIPTNVKYIKFDKTFSYSSARCCIQGHPNCIIDGFPCPYGSGPYSWETALYDFKEVRNCHTSAVNYYSPGFYDSNNTKLNLTEGLEITYQEVSYTYTENEFKDADSNTLALTDGLIINYGDTEFKYYMGFHNRSVIIGIQNYLIGQPNPSKYTALKPSYNYTGTRFINCDIGRINKASALINCRIYDYSASPSQGVVQLTDIKCIDNLQVESLPNTNKAKVELVRCSHLSNISSNGYTITYTNCSYIDTQTCDNAPSDPVFATKTDLTNKISSSTIKEILSISEEDFNNLSEIEKNDNTKLYILI